MAELNLRLIGKIVLVASIIAVLIAVPMLCDKAGPRAVAYARLSKSADRQCCLTMEQANLPYSSLKVKQ